MFVTGNSFLHFDKQHNIVGLFCYQSVQRMGKGENNCDDNLHWSLFEYDYLVSFGDSELMMTAETEARQIRSHVPASQCFV